MIPPAPASFQRILLALVIAAVTGSVTHAQHNCEFGGEEAASKLDNALEHVKSCTEAVDLFDECRWGSSADVGFGRIVIERCEKNYLSTLTPEQKRVYLDKMQLCTYQYSLQDGTLAISEATSCHVAVAAEFDANLAKAAVPLPPASFDCKLGKSTLEKAICSDPALGRADLVLSDVYSALLKFEKGDDKTTLVMSQRKWLHNLSEKCGLTDNPASKKARACLLNEFETRFTLLDGCADDLLSCLSSNSER